MFFLKTNIVVLFGGVSVEHDISVLTGLQVLKALDKSKYKVFPVYITKNGQWHLYDDVREPKDLIERRSKKVFLKAGDNHLFSESLSVLTFNVTEVHCALLCTHGTNGEDGVLQGVLTASNIPFTSPDVKSSAITMDKAITKTILKSKGFCVVEGIAVSSDEWFKDIKSAKNKIAKLDFPMVIKPASLGSSIGVSVVHDASQLNEACELCFELDNKLLAEKFVKSVEVNCSATMVNGDILSSDVEMVMKNEDFLSFDDKYRGGDKGKLKGDNEKGLVNQSRVIPAPLEDELTEEIKFLTSGIYKCLECDGVIRVDYLLDEDNKLYVNEVNTIPGSLAYYLWKEKFDFSKLLDEIILQAIRKHNKLNNLTRVFDSHIINT